MSVLLCLFIMIVVYIASFNKDFDKELIDKTLPFIVGIGIIVLILSIVSAK